MDSELLRQREAFRRRAAAQPAVSQRPAKREAPSPPPRPLPKSSSKKRKTSAAPKTSESSEFATASSSGMSANFGVMAKIVDHLKKRHLEQKTWSLSLKELLEELQIYDMNKRTQLWLVEALPRNPRIAAEGERYMYKPPYKVKGKNSLLNVLKRNDLEGRGGVLLSDLADCINAPDKLVQALGDAVVDVSTTVSKRKDRVFFYNDPESVVHVAEEFKQLWRGVSVSHLDEKKIEEYLQKHGIDSMKDLAPKNAAAAPKRKTRKGRQTQMQNEHLAEGLLQDYNND